MIFKKKLTYTILKVIFEILIIILFFGGYLRIFSGLQNNITIKLFFTITYIWFSIGMNVNFIIPLLKLINNKINKE